MDLETLQMLLGTIDTLGVVAICVWRLTRQDKLVDALLLVHERTAGGDRETGEDEK